MIDRSKKIPAFFYESVMGNQPVREWILGLSLEDRKLVGRDIQKVEFGWPLGMPYCRSLGNGLWEVRSDLTDGKIGRVIFCVTRGRIWRCCTASSRKHKRPWPGSEARLKHM